MWKHLAEWVGIGVFAALAVLTRPEGILYAGALYLGLGVFALLRAWQARIAGRRAVWRALRGPIIAAAVGAVPILAFSAILYRLFGIFWPTGWTNVAGLHFILPNYRLILKQNLPHYAAVSGLPDPATTGTAIAAAVCVLAVLGLARLCLAQPYLWFVPLALALNLAVIFVSPTYLTPDLFSPPTFFRHLSVLFPWLVPAFAALLTLRPRRRSWVVLAVPVALVLLLTELTVLGVSTARDQAQLPTIFTQDPYVLVTDLWQAQETLPQLPFTTGGAREVATIDPTFDYLGFRRRLFEAVRPYDLHFNDAGRAYVLAAGVFGLAGLGALAWVRLGRDQA